MGIIIKHALYLKYFDSKKLHCPQVPPVFLPHFLSTKNIKKSSFNLKKLKLWKQSKNRILKQDLH